MKLSPLVLLMIAASAIADSPQQIATAYATQAAAEAPGFKPSAQRGRNLFSEHFTASGRMPSCTSCHTEKPMTPGRHVVTSKEIAPLAPAANPERFTDAAKVEKWFRRNCKEVVGRECTAAEKADFIQFAMEVR